MHTKDKIHAIKLTFETLFSNGFRPFFLGAGIYGFLSVFLWMGIYTFSWKIQPSRLAPMLWHGHEMIYGYSMAVAAGFLLTAVQNWTGIKSLRGFSLFILFALWVVVRFLLFSEWLGLIYVAILDNLFIVALMVSVSIPVVRAKQWRNFSVISKLGFLVVSNVVFYLGVLKVIPDGERIGLYLGLYFVVALVIMMGRRIIPFFTGRGVGYEVVLRNWKGIDRSALFFFLAFSVMDIWKPTSFVTAMIAGILTLLYGIRLFGWYTHGIWQRPLLWVLHAAYASVVLAFLFKVMAFIAGAGANLAVHSFAYGAIGLSTLGMMSRVSLGHTGRNVHTPPKPLRWIFLVLVLGLGFRTIMPVIAPAGYVAWVLIAQFCWMVTFAGFIWIYTPILLQPRGDGR